MKPYANRAHNLLQNPTGEADGETGVPNLPGNSKPQDGSSPAIKQAGQLTSRELEVLQLVARGKLNKQMASELCISIKTVEKHRIHLTSKLGVRGTAGLTHYAIYAGIIECDPQMTMA